MKKLPKYYSIIGTAMLVWGAFLLPSFASATTVYQQLTDASLQQGVNTNNCTNMGSFTLATTTYFIAGDTGLVVASINNSSLHATGLELRIGSGPVNSNCSFVGGGGTTYGVFDSQLYDGATSTGDLFMTITVPTPYTLSAGTYYLFMGGLNQANPSWKVSMNRSGDFFYGYLTANGTGTSIPIAPGLPGFSDTGIATTSQQAYCYTNFSTSTGLLDSLGQSISLGFCNVGVFLFVPNQQALTNFSGLASNVEGRIPFSYYFDISTILNGESASSTGNFISYSSTLAATGVGSTSPISAAVLNAPFPILSTTTIMEYVPQGTYNIIFFLMESAIWVAVGLHLYRRVVPQKATHV